MSLVIDPDDRVTTLDGLDRLSYDDVDLYCQARTAWRNARPEE